MKIIKKLLGISDSICIEGREKICVVLINCYDKDPERRIKRISTIEATLLKSNVHKYIYFDPNQEMPSLPEVESVRRFVVNTFPDLHKITQN